jgi:hypothetical protein
MKKLIIGAALATLLASPVFAQSYNAGYGTGNVLDQPAAERAGSANNNAATNSYAQAPSRAAKHHAHVRSHVEAPKN